MYFFFSTKNQRQPSFFLSLFLCAWCTQRKIQTYIQERERDGKSKRNCCEIHLVHGEFLHVRTYSGKSENGYQGLEMWNVCVSLTLAPILPVKWRLVFLRSRFSFFFLPRFKAFTPELCVIFSTSQQKFILSVSVIVWLFIKRCGLGRRGLRLYCLWPRIYNKMQKVRP